MLAFLCSLLKNFIKLVLEHCRNNDMIKFHECSYNKELITLEEIFDENE